MTYQVMYSQAPVPHPVCPLAFTHLTASTPAHFQLLKYSISGLAWAASSAGILPRCQVYIILRVSV